MTRSPLEKLWAVAKLSVSADSSTVTAPFNVLDGEPEEPLLSTNADTFESIELCASAMPIAPAPASDPPGAIARPSAAPMASLNTVEVSLAVTATLPALDVSTVLPLFMLASTSASMTLIVDAPPTPSIEALPVPPPAPAPAPPTASVSMDGAEFAVTHTPPAPASTTEPSIVALTRFVIVLVATAAPTEPAPLCPLPRFNAIAIG